MKESSRRHKRKDNVVIEFYVQEEIIVYHLTQPSINAHLVLLLSALVFKWKYTKNESFDHLTMKFVY